MICDEVRPWLPEHLLGTLDEPVDRSIGRHLRGCATCRAERGRLEDGVVALSHAAHEQTPPDELRDRVLHSLREERADPGSPAGERPIAGRRSILLPVAASIALLALVGSLWWGVTASRSSDLAAADARSYRTLLATLGGREFRAGTLAPAEGVGDLRGEILVYEGDPRQAWSSWALLRLHAPGMRGSATATLLEPGGRTLALPPLRFGDDGEAAALLTGAGDLSGFDRLTVNGPDGTVIASASIRQI